MATVFRIKRALNEDPLDALVVKCKKRKIDDETDNLELPTLLKFAGTVENQEEKDILKYIKKPTKAELEEQYKKHNVDVSSKLRLENQENSKNSRYKVINCFRSEKEESDSSSVTVFDLEVDKEVDKTAESLKSLDYVYDLYYTNSDDFGDELDEYISIYPLSENLIFGSKRDNGLSDSEIDDSDDSNDENNWRNNYPDESDMESINEDDMVKAVENIALSDLSSDDGEEGFVYSIDSEAAGFEEDIDDSDVRRYGEMYARFKARHKEETDKNIYYGDIDEEEYYY